MFSTGLNSRLFIEMPIRGQFYWSALVKNLMLVAELYLKYLVVFLNFVPKWCLLVNVIKEVRNSVFSQNSVGVGYIRKFPQTQFTLHMHEGLESHWGLSLARPLTPWVWQCTQFTRVFWRGHLSIILPWY